MYSPYSLMHKIDITLQRAQKILLFCAYVFREDKFDVRGYSRTNISLFHISFITASQELRRRLNLIQQKSIQGRYIADVLVPEISFANIKHVTHCCPTNVASICIVGVANVSNQCIFLQAHCIRFQNANSLQLPKCDWKTIIYLNDKESFA